MNSITKLLTALAVLICCSAVTAAATLQAKVVEVTTGNTLVVSNTNRSVRIRLKSVVPPEAGDPGGSGDPAGTPPSGSLAARTNRPAAAALIAGLIAAGFTLARWQTWAERCDVLPLRPYEMEKKKALKTLVSK